MSPGKCLHGISIEEFCLSCEIDSFRERASKAEAERDEALERLAQAEQALREITALAGTQGTMMSTLAHRALARLSGEGGAE